MKQAKWLVFAAALGMIVVAGVLLGLVRQRMKLTAPAVSVGPRPVHGTDGRVIASQSVLLPLEVQGAKSVELPVTDGELAALPRDTTFGRRRYVVPGDNFRVDTSVVLMGTDHTSIHQPQYCLYAQAWEVAKTEKLTFPMELPYPYELPVVKMIASHKYVGENKAISVTNCVYIYWFVAENKISTEEGSRLWSIAANVLRKGEIERWAYISFFTTCIPGEESVTLHRLENFIQASAPQFQLVPRKPLEQPGPNAARK